MAENVEGRADQWSQRIEGSLRVAGAWTLHRAGREGPYDELSDIGEYSGMEGDISGGVSENDTEEEEMTKTRDDDI